MCQQKMFEPVMRSSQLFSESSNMKVFNKAFQSLSFRGNRGYSDNLITRSRKQVNKSDECRSQVRAATYGAILRTQREGEDLYALVQGRYTGKWSFPKGHSNEGEEPFKCTMREVGEETGIDELPVPIDYVRVGYGNYFIFSLEEPLALIPRDTNEIMDTKWVTMEEMEKMPLNADASLYRKQLKYLV